MNWDHTYQIGVVVADLDRAREHFERAGVGPFREGPSQVAFDRVVYGESAPDVEVRGLLAQMGPLEFELLSPIRGRSVQADALSQRGEHALHICSRTDDLEREIAAMAAAGFTVISRGRFDDGGAFAYFDTRTVGGVILEMFQPGDRYR
jgi:methylmalonyl-CoA/ethylmalonyl-CoA epimerase